MEIADKLKGKLPRLSSVFWEPKKVEQLFSGVWDLASWWQMVRLRDFLKIWISFTVEGPLFMADWLRNARIYITGPGVRSHMHGVLFTLTLMRQVLLSPIVRSVRLSAHQTVAQCNPTVMFGCKLITGLTRRKTIDFVVSDSPFKIGRAHVWTPVTVNNIVCRLLLAKKKRAHMGWVGHPPH